MPLPCLRVKPGTRFDVIAPGGFRLLSALDAATMILGKDLTITAGTDDHTEGKHPIGEAFDVRTQGLSEAEIITLVQFLRARLGAAFSVFYETHTMPLASGLKALTLINAGATAPHLHLQVRKGTVWPPLAD